MQQQGGHNNQKVNMRQTGGEVSLDKRQQSVKKSRGGSGMMIGVMATSLHMRGKGGGGTSRQKGGSVLKAGAASRQEEVKVARQEDKRRRQCIVKMRGKGGGKGGVTRGNLTTSQGKLEVNGRRTFKGLVDKR